MAELHWTEVNGVTTIWAEGPEPMRAGLMFRTGRADETLVTAGHTHLIEHMAMAEMSDFIPSSNAFVGDTFTGFVTMGSPEDICAFFRKLCGGLASLPAERLEAEKKILLAEAAGRQYDVRENLLVWRYGATGYGLVGLREMGIRGATIEQLQAWRTQQFTRENAILWLSGPVPAELRLDLPPGKKQPVPQFAPIQGTFPSWFVDDRCGGVAASATVPRLAAGMNFNAVAAKRMHEVLRNQQAVSYYPTIFYEPLNGDIAHLVLFADSELDRRAELARAFGEVFEKLSEVGEKEVEAARKLILDQMTGSLAPPLADLVAGDAQRAATDWLFGRPYETLDQLAEEARSVTADQVNTFAQVVRNQTIFAVPGKTIIAPWMGERIPISLGKMVEGREIPHADAPVQTDRLVIGAEGVSIKADSQLHLTVRYDNLVAALHYDDGGLCLVSSDSTWLPIEPTLWRDRARICGEILGKIPAHLILEQGPRDQDAIPMPRTTAWQRFRAPLIPIFDRLFGMDNQSAGAMSKSVKRNAFLLLGLRVLIDLILVAVSYQRSGNWGQVGLIFFNFIFYLLLFLQIKNESIYGDQIPYARHPKAYWSILGFLLLFHLVFSLGWVFWQ